MVFQECLSNIGTIGIVQAILCNRHVVFDLSFKHIPHITEIHTIGKFDDIRNVQTATVS